MNYVSFLRRGLILTTFYCLALQNAIAADAPSALRSQLEAQRSGEMLKFAIHPEPQEISNKAFGLAQGDDLHISDFKGKWVLINFWATWCAPCRVEMPSLAKLQDTFQSDTFEVLTIATTRNSPRKIKEFFTDVQISNLPQYMDRNGGALARSIGVLGLPTTILVAPDGQEVGRLIGEADWSGDDAVAFFHALVK